MTKFRMLILTAAAVIVFASCKDYVYPTDTTAQDPVFKVTFEKFAEAPASNQSMMLLDDGAKIYVCGCYDFMVYDTTAKSWEKTALAVDSVTGRWDGALFKYGSSIYEFGAPPVDRIKFYNVVKFNINSKTGTMLNEELPVFTYVPYPAYAVNGTKLLSVFTAADSVYEFDAATEKGRYVAENKLHIFYVTNNVEYVFGSYNGWLYIYNKSYADFYRFNMTSYIWQKIEIAEDRKKLLVDASGIDGAINGAIFNGKLFLYKSGIKAFMYDLTEGKWYREQEGSDLLTGRKFFESRWADDNKFYFIEAGAKNLWRVKITK